MKLALEFTIAYLINVSCQKYIFDLVRCIIENSAF